MRVGLRAKIVSIVTFVLFTALLAAGGGYRQFEIRLLASSASPSLPPRTASVFARWFRSHGSWAGADALCARIAPADGDLVLVQTGRVQASSASRFDGASAAIDGRGGLHVVRRPSLAGERGERLDLEGAPVVEIGDGTRIVGELYEVPRLSLARTGLPDASDAWLARRLVLYFALVGIAAAVVGAFLTSYVMRPIRELTAAARSASGAAFPRVPVRSSDEIGDLARAFNALAERLAISEAAREALVCDVSHELRTPLTNVRCSLESFQDGVDDVTPHALQSVLDDVFLLERLIGDLHGLSATTPELVVLDRSWTNIASEARSAAEAFGDRAAQRDMRIDIVESGTMPSVLADRARIRQVLHNLLDNAVRHGRSGGTVTVRIAPESSDVCVRVLDDGEGFPASEEDAVFERFHRLDASRSRGTGGSGLGLAIAKRLIDEHGGRIGAVGGLGRGATVWFTLPNDV